MEKLKIHLTGEVKAFERGLQEVLPLLELTLSEDGIPVQVEQCDRLRVQLSAQGGRIGYRDRVHFFRALSLMSQFGLGVDIEENAAFDKNGVMFDASRNAVLTPQSLKSFFCRMALMGLNLGMMYTEDTYEVKGYPYFGYLRGGYTSEELRELDDYADMLGIELVPCIQTLAHLDRALHWQVMRGMWDIDDILLCDEEETHRLVRRMMECASAPYRTRRIHVGMDEAQHLGLGRYLKKHGYQSGFSIMQKHLEMVRSVAQELGLEPMMWSDMYFRLASPTEDYYDLGAKVPQEIVDAAPGDMSLVYWDYYHHDEDTYRTMLQEHQRFSAKTIFAGGVWTWADLTVNYDKTYATTLPALKVCKELGIREVFATAWGDDGAECNLQGLLYGLQIFAELGYREEFDESWTRARFAACTGADAEAFLALSKLNRLPGVERTPDLEAHPARCLLYEDPLMPMFEADFAGLSLGDFYGKLAQEYHGYAASQVGYSLLFTYYEQLCRVLEKKCAWRENAAAAVRAGDRTRARELAPVAGELAEALGHLREVSRALWLSTNRPYGFEVVDQRLGGAVARAMSAKVRMEDFAAGKIDTIEELASPKLLLSKTAEGLLGPCSYWHEMVSAGRL